MNDFVKKNILECYGLMRDYFHGDVESDKDYNKMCNGIDRLRIGIPEEVYEKIMEFVYKELAPLVEGEEDHDTVFAECIEAEKNGDDSEMGAAYLRLMFSVDGKIEKFATEVLRPYLL